MKFKEAFYRVLCKLGIHSPRVWGHTEEEKPEYYYCCLFCDDGFWDYAIPNQIIEEVDRAITKRDYSEFVPIDTH